MSLLEYITINKRTIVLKFHKYSNILNSSETALFHSSQHLVRLQNVRSSHHTPPSSFFCSPLPPCSQFFSFPFPELNEWKVLCSTMEAGLVGMPEMSGVSRILVAMGNTPPMTSQTVHSTHLLTPLHFSPTSLRFSKVKRDI